MPRYIANSCDCSGGEVVISNEGRCTSCGTSLVDLTEINQKRMWNQVRAPSSLYTMNLAALNVVGSSDNQPLAQYGNVNWNQASDRNRPSNPSRYVPTRGNSTRSTVTSNRPGASAPAGKGVDVKHNSYDRYLARKKAGHLRTQQTESAVPLYGNKKKMYGLSAHSKIVVCS